MMEDLRALLTPLNGLSANAKYALVRSLCGRYQLAPSMSLDELSREFGLTKQALIKARAELLEPVEKYSGGYWCEATLCLTPLGRDPRGRPRKGFRVNPVFEDSLRDGEVEASIPNEGICRLLIRPPVDFLRSNQVQGETVKNRLSALNRYFLALLWALADGMGRIWGKDLEEISRLAGMSPVQADGQLSKLERLGYIRERVRGRSWSPMFEGFSGGIFLEPRQPMLTRFWGMLGVSWIADECPVAFGGLLDDVDGIFQGAEKIENAKKILSDQGKSWRDKAWLDTGWWVKIRLDKAQWDKELQDKTRDDIRENQRAFEVWDFPDVKISDQRHPNGFYSVFLNAPKAIRQSVCSIVTWYGKRLFDKNYQSFLDNQGVHDRDILNEIQSIIDSKDMAINDGSASRMALWLYRHAHHLASEISRVMDTYARDNSAKTHADIRHLIESKQFNKKCFIYLGGSNIFAMLWRYDRPPKIPCFRVGAYGRRF